MELKHPSNDGDKLNRKQKAYRIKNYTLRLLEHPMGPRGD